MEWEQIVGRWRQLGGEAKTRWGKLTENDWRVVRESRARLIAKLRQRYGVSTKEAEQHVKHFEDMH